MSKTGDQQQIYRRSIKLADRLAAMGSVKARVKLDHEGANALPGVPTGDLT